MGIILLKIGRPSPLPPGEKVVMEQSRFRAVSSWTSPSYRVGFNLPPLWQVRLLVTTRRCLVVTDFFHCLTQEIGMWFPGETPGDDPETITGVCCRTGWLGRCLEIRTHNPRRRQRWVWSPDLTLRFYMKDPERIESVIRSEMNNSGAICDRKPLPANSQGAL